MIQHVSRSKPRSLLIVLLCALSAVVADRVQAHEETFESPETTWRLAESDCRPLRFSKHERQFTGAHSGNGCEHLQVVAGQGTHIYLAHSIPPTRIIAELKPSIWVKSDRHGLQLMARVVLPRSRENGKPITSFVFGDRYDTDNVWRQLRIDDILTKLNREVVALRTQKGPQLDGREAYIDLLVLNAYTGPGPTKIWVDDLHIDGFAPASEIAANRDEFPATQIEANPVTPADSPQEGGGVALQGSILVAAGRPLFVRAIEHQGETFAFLQSLGFNAVKLAAAPTAGQLQDAERCGIWLIGPPPISAISKPEEGPWSQANHRVLTWHLGENLTARDSQVTLARIDELQHREPAFQRPSVAQIASGFSQWRQDSLIQLLEHPVLHSSFEMQDFHEWLEHAARQNRSQAPFWCAIPTEPGEQLISQVNHLRARLALQLEPDQVRWLAFAAVGSGARGLWFRSRSRLDGQDPVTRRRSATLQFLNRELELVSPWAAGGTAEGEQATNNPRLRVFSLKTDRARLLILLRRTADQQFVIAPSDQEQNAVTLHHPPPTDQTYSVSPAGIQHITSQRGAGMKLTFASPDVVSLMLLTSDPMAVNYVGRTSAAIRPEIATARREILTQLLEETESVEKLLQGRGVPNPRSVQKLADARLQLRRAVELRESGDIPSMLGACDAAADAIRNVRRGRWEQVVQTFTSPVASPLCVAYSTLPDHFELRDRLASANWGVDMLAGGEMEYLPHLLDSGWKQQRSDLSGISADVRLSLDAAHGGRSCLNLRAWSSEQSGIALDGEAPVTITSAPIMVQAGQLMKIRGWAKVPRKLSDSSDGLMIFDSQSGPDLAERISETQGWREFTLYRVPSTTGEWRLILSLTGLGEAWIDDVSVVAVIPTPARQAARR